MPRIPKIISRKTVMAATFARRGIDDSTVLTRIFSSGRVVSDRKGRITRNTLKNPTFEPSLSPFEKFVRTN